MLFYLLRPWFSVYRISCSSSWNASCSFVVHIVLLHGYLIGIGQWGMTCITPLLHRPHCRNMITLPITNMGKKSYDLSHTRKSNLAWNFSYVYCLFCSTSQFVGVEGFVTAIVDLFPNHLRRGHRKEIFIALCSAFWFLIGLSMVTEVITQLILSIRYWID